MKTVMRVRSLSASSPVAAAQSWHSLPVQRLEHAGIDAVERIGRRRQLAQHELHDLAGLGAGDDEADHALDGGLDLRLGFGRRGRLRLGKGRAAERLAGDGLDGVDDIVGGGQPEPFLAAEMIGDRADIGAGGRRDLARRRAVEALPAEQLQRRHDKRHPGGLGGGGGLLRRSGFVHGNSLINRLINVNHVALHAASRFTDVMAKEVERKFLVDGQAWRSHVEDTIRIRQFYLASNTGRSVRLRISDGKRAKLTLKFGSRGRERDEFEYKVPLADAEEMQQFAIGRIIEKTRHHVRHGGYLYEIDVFEGELSGLVIAELETPEDVAASELPPWIGREVTSDPRYYNATLALNDAPVAVA